MIRTLDRDEAHLLVPLAAIVQQLHSSRFPGIFHSDPAATAVEGFFRSWLSNPAVSALIAEPEPGVVAGYVLLEVQEIRGSALSVPRRRGFVHHIGVLPDHRRRGLGSALLTAAQARFRAEGLAVWGTSYWHFNLASAALMAKHGLQPLHLVAEGPL